MCVISNFQNIMFVKFKKITLFKSASSLISMSYHENEPGSFKGSFLSFSTSLSVSIGPKSLDSSLLIFGTGCVSQNLYSVFSCSDLLFFF